MPIPKNKYVAETQRIEVAFKLKTNPVTKKCKIVKLKLKGGLIINSSTVYKNLDLDTAKDYMYSLERGRLPMI